MQNITSEKRIQDDAKCTLLAYGITPLHAIGIDATYSKLFEDRSCVTGYIIIGSHPTTGKSLSPEYFYSGAKRLHFVEDLTITRKNPLLDRWEALKLCWKKKHSQELYIICTEIKYEWFMLLKKQLKNADVKYVLIDDGGGSYADIYKDRLRLALNNEHIYGLSPKYLLIAIKMVFRVNYMKILEKVLIHNECLLDYRIFRIKNKKFKRNDEICDFYVDQFRIRGTKSNNQLWQCFEDASLINTQCLVENGITDGVVDLEIYKKVIGILESLKQSIVIKTHPREKNIEKYRLVKDVNIYSDPSVSQEIILASCHKPPKCIISIFSSTLLNAYGLFDIPAISLAKIALKYNISDVFRKQLKDYIEQYKSVFEFPKDYEELKSLLASICK